uniref:NADH-ubiquinone oxidoreductase chain 6 n=2 Tax=Leiolepis TaxID=52195 RepID=A0A0A8J2C0_9SAUR|nr:NADH dehydrogenase subunit 6 [Leiolepis guttata]BAJ08149.1 NADH dehydrogenase subunit 6 [Leiolepis guttata]BAQ00132.1 NADH dehydrogenase subunit 6 [Leiolepis boehmei]
MYFVLFIVLAVFLGMVGVASNPSPCFGAGALMVCSSFGCAFLVELEESFVALVLFLVYLGGMLVVFAYSVALSSDIYPEAWGSWFVVIYVLSYLIGFLLVGWWVGYDHCGFGVWVGANGGAFVECSGFDGVSLLYEAGGLSLMVVGVGLLLTLFVVLELVRGVSFSSKCAG